VDGSLPCHIAAFNGRIEVLSVLHAHDPSLLSETNDSGETVSAHT